MMSTDNPAPWVDPEAIRQLVDSVRDGFAATPVWARIGLVAMLGITVLAGVFRVFLSMPGRMVGVVLVVVVLAVAWLAASGGHIAWLDWLSWP